jgi:hypothetical protein
VKKLAARWIALWDRREHPAPLALVRIGVGLVIAYDLVYATALGVADDVWSKPSIGGLAWASGGTSLSRAFGDSTAFAPALVAVAVGSALTLSIGLFTRTSALVLVLSYAEIGGLTPESDRGIDILLRAALVVLALSRAGAYWSVDAYRKTGTFAPFLVRIPAWPRYLLVVQLVWMYFSAATHKLQAPWTPLGGFSALYYVLLDPHFARFDFAWLRDFYPLTQIATAITMTFEWSAPFLLLAYHYEATRDRPGRLRKLMNRIRFRWVWLAVGVSFHVMLVATIRLGIFPFGMLALYAAFLKPRELAAVLRQVRSWRPAREIAR